MDKQGIYTIKGKSNNWLKISIITFQIIMLNILLNIVAHNFQSFDILFLFNYLNTDNHKSLNANRRIQRV